MAYSIIEQREMDMMNYYRIRQVAACFVLERYDYPSQFGANCWQIIDQGWSWDWAERVAAEYRCEIV